MKEKFIAPAFYALENLKGFYGFIIKEGTILYPYQPEKEKPFFHRGKWYYRYVFDTTPGNMPKAHNVPQGNIRIASIVNKKEWDENIRPLTKEEIEDLKSQNPIFRGSIK